jgi:hypothetical protein
MTEFCVDSTNKPATQATLAKLSTTLMAKPGRYTVKVTRYQNKGTAAQRGYFHAALVEQLVDFQRDQGVTWDHHTAHQFLKHRYRKRIEIVDLNGEVIGYEPQDGAVMSIGEWSEFIELVVSFLTVDLGLRVQEPTPWYSKTEAA